MNKKSAMTIGLLLLFLSIYNMRPFIKAARAAESLHDTTSWVININTASAGEIAAIPGLGDKKSQAIIKFREKHGPFAKPEDLKKVDGIGDKLFEKIMPYIVIKGDTTFKSSQR